MRVTLMRAMPRQPLTRLDLAYQQQITQLRTQMLALGRRFWNSGQHNERDVARALRQLVPHLEAGQAKIAAATAAYQARTVDQHARQAGRELVPAPDVSTQTLRGVPPEEVYRRPFVETWTALAEGKSVAAATAAGAARLQSVISTSAQLAKTHTTRAVFEGRGVRMTERVLKGRKNCGLCIVASTQRYWAKDLQPIHPGCDCDQRAWRGDPDEQVIHPDRLEWVHEVVNGPIPDNLKDELIWRDNIDRGARSVIGRPGDYRDAVITTKDILDSVVTYEHGEIGPVLAWRGQKHTILPR